MQNRKHPPFPKPFELDDQVVPATGAEYNVKRKDMDIGLRRLRWAVASPGSKTMKVWISHVMFFDGSKPLAEWIPESKDVLVAAAEKAFPHA